MEVDAPALLAAPREGVCVFGSDCKFLGNNSISLNSCHMCCAPEHHMCSTEHSLIKTIQHGSEELHNVCLDCCIYEHVTAEELSISQLNPTIKAYLRQVDWRDTAVTTMTPRLAASLIATDKMKPECEAFNTVCEECDCTEDKGDPLKHCYDCNLSYCSGCVKPPLVGKLGTDAFAHWFCKGCFSELKQEITKPKPKQARKRTRKKRRGAASK